MIEDLAKKIPKEIRNRSGSVFYSGRDAFSGSSKLYILGINPGGNPVAQAEETVDWHTGKSSMRNRENGRSTVTKAGKAMPRAHGVCNQESYIYFKNSISSRATCRPVMLFL